METSFHNTERSGHSLLERYAKNEIATYDLADTYKAEYADNITKSAPPNRWKDLNKSYYDAGLSYFENFEGFGEYKILAVEFKVNFKIGKYRFTGFIDLVLEDKDGNIIIVDHKSKTDIKKNEIEKYLYQLYLYSVAVKEAFGKYPTQLRFNLFKTNIEITKDFIPEDLEKANNWFLTTIQNIYDEKDFVPTKSEFFCDFLCDVSHCCNCSKNYVGE